MVVDNTPPEVLLAASTNVFTLDAKGEGVLIFKPEVLDESPIGRWEFKVVDLSSRTIHVYSSSGALQDLVWNGLDQETQALAPRGNYVVTYQAWDKAGNASLPFMMDIEVEVAAQQMLEAVLQYTTVFETDMGLIVQLPAKDIFRIEKKAPVLNEVAEVYLREVAILANAYPDVSIQLDGYSRKLGSTALDRERGSRYAWRVYSYLVKKGNVKASRLTVRGRGRSAMFDRRSVNDPPDFDLLKNGVEVILEGNRDWAQ